MQRVHELISEGTSNKELLREIFDGENYQRITNIPISEYGDKDRLIWMFSKLGEYTVKTGYVVAKELQRKGRRESQQQGSSSRNDANSGVWRFL